MPPDAGFAAADWLILVAYLAVVVAIGVAAGRRSTGRDELFLAGRGMPMWAAAVSVLATSLSAATFIGGPQQAYASDLTYFSANVGGLIAVILVATIFVPAYYRAGVTSVYELLGTTFGAPVRTAASAMFMLGRVMASGARLFMVALPFALVVFGDTSPGSLLASIVLITVVATAYTAVGGIRAVIWTDVLQAVVLVATVGVALAVVWSRIPAGFGEVVATLRDAPGGDKLRVLSTSRDPGAPFTVWTALIGFTLFNLAAFGTDQDLTQRMLTCRTPRAGAWSAVVANLLSWPVVLLFLVLGLLLYVYYQAPALMGANAPGYVIDDTRKVFLEFILNEMPRGLRGLMIAGLFAAAMSSLDSALGAMASTTVADFYRRWRPGDGSAAAARREAIVSRLAIVGWAFPLAGFAGACVYWQEASGQTLIVFALSVMLFAYAGLLAVFLTALLTRRGNTASALAALATGFTAVLLMKPFAWGVWAPVVPLVSLPDAPPAFPWQMALATALATAVCCAGRRGVGASS